MSLTADQIEIIKRCKNSCVYFIRNFVKVKHPSAGQLDFNPWPYQVKALESFRKKRFNIFKKTRQAGISKVAGAFALWFAMFHGLKNVLIVSKTDLDAITFLEDNVKFPFYRLPDWMRSLWDPKDINRGGKDNSHELKFAGDIGGSTIRSLTSAPNVLRSNSSSLNIIDEAAFIEKMDVMWAAGYSTLTHGGSVIVISTCNGLGNWYWSTYVDAEAGLNDFNPIKVDWWDMTWSLEYFDQLSGQKIVISPTAGLRPTSGKDEEIKYGKYWSPWLESQYRNLQERGEAWKFRQEVLADFVGSGNTVVDIGALKKTEEFVSQNFNRVVGIQAYINPITGEKDALDMTGVKKEEGFWIWEKPVRGSAARRQGAKLLEASTPAHTYVMGVDGSTGKGEDYNAIVVFDVDTAEQVAELMVHCLPNRFVRMIDRIGRYYNNALVIIERNNGGDSIIDDLRDECAYPRIWRKKNINDKPGNTATPVSYATPGHFTNDATKAVLNKYLQDFILESGEGVKIRSPRLLKQLHLYVRKRDRYGRDTGKTGAEVGPGNHDDLVMACAMALIGFPDSVGWGAGGLIPTHRSEEFVVTPDDTTEMSRLMQRAGSQLLAPVTLPVEDDNEMNIMMEINKYAQQLGAMPLTDTNTFVTPKKYDWNV